MWQLVVFITNSKFIHISSSWQIAWDNPSISISGNVTRTLIQYKDVILPVSHRGDKMILWPSYLHNGISYTDKTTTKLFGGYIGFTPSVCLSVRPASRVRSVASTVQDGFFPYLVQMINRMRGCVACDDPWPWPISSRSFGLDLKNRVRSVASTILDGFFLFLAQMITIIRGCVACYDFFRIWKFEFLANLKKISALTLKKNLQFSMDSFHI